MKPSTWSTLTPSSVLISMLLGSYTGRLREDAILEVHPSCCPSLQPVECLVPEFWRQLCWDSSLMLCLFAWAKDELRALFMLDKTLHVLTSLSNSVVLCDNHFDSSLDTWHTHSFSPSLLLSPHSLSFFVTYSGGESLGCVWTRVMSWQFILTSRPSRCSPSHVSGEALCFLLAVRVELSRVTSALRTFLKCLFFSCH